MRKMGSLAWMCLAAVPAACDGDGGADGAEVDAGEDAGGGPSGLVLGVGDVVDLEPGEDGGFSAEVQAISGDERYAIVAISLSREPKSAWSYEVALDGETLGPPDETGPIPSSIAAHRGALGLEGALESVAAGAGAPAPPKADPPQVGDSIHITLQGPSSPETVEAEVVMVSDELVIALDRTTDPPSGEELEIDAGILEEVAGNFGEVVLPRERVYFGPESDVNGDGHVTVLFSPLVFDGTGGATAYVYPCDLLEEGAVGCPWTNGQELVYVSPPEMLASYMGTAKAITEVMAHEFQHAIYFYRKFVLNGATGQYESLYVTEGMSAMAQDVTGFQAGNLYVAAAGIEQVDDVSLADVMEYPSGYDYESDGVYRGAAYLLLRYVYDRLGGDAIDGDGDVEDLGGIAFLNAMTDVPLFGYEGLENAAGEDADALVEDFFTAMLLDDREAGGAPINDDPRFGFGEPWDDPITGNPHGATMCYDLAAGSWEVRGVPIQTGGADGEILSGGAEYILMEATEPGGTTSVEVSAEEEASLAVRLVRIS